MKINKNAFILGSIIAFAASCNKGKDSDVKGVSIQADAVRGVAILTMTFGTPILNPIKLASLVIQKPIDPKDFRYISLTNYAVAMKGPGDPECPPPENCAVPKIPNPDANDPPNPAIASNIIPIGAKSMSVEIPLNKLPPDIQALLAKSSGEALPEGNDPTGKGGDVVPQLNILLNGQVAQLGLALDGDPTVGTPVSIPAVAPAPILKK